MIGQALTGGVGVPVTVSCPRRVGKGPTDVGRGYGRHFADLIASGADVEGEARLADALVPRGARILDAGSGMGRIGAALRRAGHDAYGVDLDAGLIDQSRAAYPDLPVAQARLEQLDADFLAGHGMPATYDLVVCVGNVMVLLAEGSERSVLAAFRGLLAPGGRVLVGFSLVGAPPGHASTRPRSSRPTSRRQVSPSSPGSPPSTCARPGRTTTSRSGVLSRWSRRARLAPVGDR